MSWSGRYWQFVNLRGADDVDDRVGEWLVEAYLDSPE
jgi:hypothetical protein